LGADIPVNATTWTIMDLPPSQQRFYRILQLN
jgi:hypothetical protein